MQEKRYQTKVEKYHCTKHMKAFPQENFRHDTSRLMDLDFNCKGNY